MIAHARELAMGCAKTRSIDHTRTSADIRLRQGYAGQVLHRSLVPTNFSDTPSREHQARLNTPVIHPIG